MSDVHTFATLESRLERSRLENPEFVSVDNEIYDQIRFTSQSAIIYVYLLAIIILI